MEKQEAQKRYSYLWRNKWLTSEAKTINDMIEILREAAYDLEKMKNAGIILDPESGISDDYADLYTLNKSVADEFGLQYMCDGCGDDECNGECMECDACGSGECEGNCIDTECDKQDCDK